MIFYVDYCADVDAIRRKLEEIVRATTLWDGRVVNLQVTDATEMSMQLRVLVSARTASAAWDLRCLVREALIAFVCRELMSSLPQPRRQIISHIRSEEASLAPGPSSCSSARVGNTQEAQDCRGSPRSGR